MIYGKARMFAYYLFTKLYKDVKKKRHRKVNVNISNTDQTKVMNLSAL